MKKIFVIAPLVLALTACGTTSEFRGSSVTETKTFSNEVDYPSWYTDGPKKDDSGIYAVASEYSNDFQFSVDKAMLSAKRELASNFSSYISAMMKDFATEIGNSDVVRADVDRTTKLIVSRINLIGVQRTNFKVVREGKGYRTFVRLRYSSDESNKILMAEIQKNAQLAARFKSSKSFQELEKEVDKIEEQTAKQFQQMKGAV